MTQLTTNFSLHELTKSETALRLDIDNTPGEAETESLRLLCEKVLQPVRDHFGKGVKVNSGFRSLAVNAAAGGVQGAKPSDHTRGMAADIDSGALKLRVKTTCPVPASPDTPAPAGDSAGEARAELDRETSKALIAITEEADRAIEKLNACITLYNNARSAQ